ncbi:MAG TPA: BON domain-containing protein [Roseiarcus sp.]
MTDLSLEQAVRSALRHEPFLDSERIVVTVSAGVAKLAGEVETRTQKLAARYRAQCVSGVSEVLDELDVRTPHRIEQRVDDIETGVMNALFWDAAVPTERISAKCEKGWVTLTGEVERPYQRTSAEADARKIRGVIGVTNEIKVSPCAAARATRGGVIATKGVGAPAL